jgi:thymidine kinase
MFAGKTSELMHIIDTHGRLNKCLYINHSNDTRDTMNAFSTHNSLFDKNMSSKLNADMVKFQKLSDIPIAVLREYRTVCIDEAQFFDDIVEMCDVMVNKLNQDVFVAGLKGDFKRGVFGKLPFLLPHADEVRILKDVLCQRCSLSKIKSIAIDTHRISDITHSQIEIGTDNYIPVCRKCYNDLN